jgi:hypothetical protein
MGSKSKRRSILDSISAWMTFSGFVFCERLALEGLANNTIDLKFIIRMKVE